MLVHMDKVANSKRGDIVKSELITSLAEALELDVEIRWMHLVIGRNALDMASCLAQMMIRKIG